MIDKTNEFLVWLEAQPADRVFVKDTCGCPITCFAAEWLGFSKPNPSYSSVWDAAAKDWEEVSFSYKVGMAVKILCFGSSPTITAAKFRELVKGRQV